MLQLDNKRRSTLPHFAANHPTAAPKNSLLQHYTAETAALPDAADRAVAEIEWEYASQFERDHPLIEQVGIALGLSPEQIDTMWQEALAL